MKQAMLSAVALAIGLATAAVAQPVEAPATPPRSVTVTGEGHVRAAPEMARLRLGVSETAETARRALDLLHHEHALGVVDASFGIHAPEMGVDRDGRRTRSAEEGADGRV